METFPIQYAGLVPKISADIDPSGRTDLLKVIDKGEAEGHLNLLSSLEGFKENAEAEVDQHAIVVRKKSDKDVLLVVPLHMLVSVGFVREDSLNVVALKVGQVYDPPDSVDLAVLLAPNQKIAEDLCNHLDQRFQQLYREVISSTAEVIPDNGIRSASCSSFSPEPDMTEPYTTNHSLTTKQKTSSHAPSIVSMSTTTGTSVSSKNSVERVNEYLTMLSVCLSHEELNRFALLLKRWRAKEMPVIEFAQKLMELYGPERKHLLARMKNLLRDVSSQESAALNEFLRDNGVTENAAVSLSASTGDFSATTDSSFRSENLSGYSAGLWSASKGNLP